MMRRIRIQMHRTRVSSRPAIVAKRRRCREAETIAYIGAGPAAGQMLKSLSA
jgi:hypothetical protein